MEFAVKIAELKSFTKAAQELDIAQPSLSKSIMTLEKEIGVEIFDRKNGLKLTYAGEIYINKAKNLLRLNSELNNQMYDLSTMKRGKLTIGATSISFKFIEDTITAFCNRFSKAEIKIVHVHSESELMELLRNGDLDLIYTAHFGELNVDDFTHEFIKKRRLFLSVPSSHPILPRVMVNSTDKYPKVSLSEFCEDKFALSYKALKSNINFQKIFQKAGFEPKLFCDTSYMYVSNAMVAAGLCVGFSYVQYVFEKQKDYINLLDIADEPMLDVSFSVVYKQQSKLAKEFIKMLKASKNVE